jgi:hypothetical protein
MKRLFALYALLSASPAFAADKLPSALAGVADYVDSLNGVSENGERVPTLHFSFRANDVAHDLAGSPLCATPSAYRRIGRKELSQGLTADASKLVDALLEEGSIDQDDGYYSMWEGIDESLKALERAIGERTIEVCVDETTPAYSDAGRLVFVKVGARLAFVHGVTIPD